MNRRSFLTGVGSLFASPAIVHAGNLMPIKVIPFEPYMLVRGVSIFTGQPEEIRVMETINSPTAFLSDDFTRRFGKAVNGMLLSGLQTAAIENREDEKALRMFSHSDPVTFQPIRKQSVPWEALDWNGYPVRS